MKKNKKVLLRLNYFKNIKKKIVLKSLSKNQSLNPTIRGNLFYKKKKIFINKFNNICLITGNSNSVFKKFKMSRITFRTLAHKGLIPGISKSSW